MTYFKSSREQGFRVMLFMIDTKHDGLLIIERARFWSNVIHDRYKTSNCLAITL